MGRPKGVISNSRAVSDRCKIKMFHFNSSTVYNEGVVGGRRPPTKETLVPLVL